jgi:hypothetical protein
VRADGAAPLRVRALDVAYDVTLHLTGLAPALNGALSTANSSAPLAEVTLQLLAVEGQVRLSNLSVVYSEAPRAFPPAPVTLLEGAQNETVVDLLHHFTDDFDSAALTYTVMSVFANRTGGGPASGVATAAVHRSALDANLTVTMLDLEFSGILLISVMATDTSGLSAVLAAIHVQVDPVNDPPVVPPVLPEYALVGTTGTLDLSLFIQDNDTAGSQLTVTASSPFVSVAGLVLSFDYRSAPTTLREENITLTISDGTSQVTSRLRVLVANAGRPLIDFGAPGAHAVPAGRSILVELSPYATDDDSVANLTWELLRVDGNGTATLENGTRLRVAGTSAGSISITVSARDREGLVANGTLVVTVRSNQAPRFTALDGSAVTVTAAGPLTVDLREFLADPDDPFSNLTFNIAWDNGSALNVTVASGLLRLTRIGDGGGHARVTVTASDPSGASDSATVEVTIEGPGPGGSGFLIFLAAAIAAALIGVFLIRAYRQGQAQRRPLSRMSREAGDVQLDEEERRLLSPEGLEPSEKEQMLGKIDEMEREAGASRLELPPVTLVSPAGASATTSLLLLYRDGRPVAWLASAAPSDREAELEQELAAAVAERLKKGATGARIEGEAIEMGGRVFALEARSQLVLAARVEGGPKNQALRQAMRVALDDLFDRNTGPLKRWDGSPRSISGVDAALEAVMRVAPVAGGDPAPPTPDAGEE